MVTLNEAVKIVSKVYPECRIVGAVSTSDAYAFRMLNRICDPTNIFDLPVSCCLAAVKKGSGKVFSIHTISDNVGEFEPVDVSLFIEKEDAQFLKKIAEYYS